MNAEAVDDSTTEQALHKADIILFAAGAQNGGLSKSEAQWLKNIHDIFRGRLRERLIFVLTKCGEIEDGDEAHVTKKFVQDFQQVLGFEPQRIIRTDSHIWSSGKKQNESLLIQYGGINELRDYITAHCKEIQETMVKDADKDLSAVKDVLMSKLEHLKSDCDEQIKVTSSQGAREEIESLFVKTAKEIKEETNRSAIVVGSFYCSANGFKYFEGKSSYSVMSNAKDFLEKYASSCLSDVHTAEEQCMKDIKKRYGSAGVGSVYFEVKDAVNKALEDLFAMLNKKCIHAEKMEEITINPDPDYIARAVSNISDNFNRAEYWSPREHVSIFGNWLEVTTYEDYYEERGLFGTIKFKAMYQINTGKATSEVHDHMRTEYKRACEYAEEEINRVMQPFLKEVREEADKHLKKMRETAEKYCATALTVASQPFQDAKAYLDEIAKEVQ